MWNLLIIYVETMITSETRKGMLQKNLLGNIQLPHFLKYLCDLEKSRWWLI